ncbi:glycosyltransferase [uncultured Fusobacterium sp.]|uniref:glycosyltransferase n=1 Tax=uncultured Fusobacterium sp. TaxID=159267 RepID=UPI0025D6B584|nr:glycosyltransferase [uncultured Fusobacterium sp.]
MDISIIVPIYNVEEYLVECLKSIYKIENLRYEVILVNDGSKDKSYKIMEDFKALYPNQTVLINKENGGLSSARNAGLRVAKGRYVSFIDSDDFIDTVEFEKFVIEGIKSRVDIAVGNMRYYVPGRIGEPLFRSKLIKEAGTVTGIDFLWTLFQQPKCYREEVVDDIYRRDFLIKNNLFFNEEIVHEDSEFTTLAYLRAKKIKYIDKAFYFYRQREGSIMNKVSEKSMVSLEKICEKLFLEFKKLNNNRGKEALATLILSFYSTVVYKRYNGGGDYKRVYKRYRELYAELKKYAQSSIEYKLLSFSLFIPNMIRKILGKEISNVQKVPKF